MNKCSVKALYSIDDMNLREFQGAFLNGITVGKGSLVFIFSNGAQIVVQCAFEFTNGDFSGFGHGEDPASSIVLFDCLNQRVVSAEMRPELKMLINFDNASSISINAECDGLESYVISTSAGIFPVAVYCF